MSDTPRTDFVRTQINEDGVPARTAIDILLQLSEKLEREGQEFLADGADDAKRLIGDKMRMFERITDLETALTAAQQSIREMEGDARRWKKVRKMGVLKPGIPTETKFVFNEDADQAIDSAMDSSSPAGAAKK